MELSPLDIRSQKFSKKLKGYDVTEVDSFLEVVAKDMEKLYSEYYGLKEELVKKNQEISDYKEKDKSISEAILMVQSVAEDIKKAAETQAEAVKKVAVSDAVSIKEKAISEAKEIIGNARKKHYEILNNIEGLLNNRTIILNTVRNILATNLEIINRESEKDSSFFDIAAYKPEQDGTGGGAEDKNTGANESGRYLADFMAGEASEKDMDSAIITSAKHATPEDKKTEDNNGEFSF